MLQNQISQLKSEEKQNGIDETRRSNKTKVDVYKAIRVINMQGE